MSVIHPKILLAAVFFWGFAILCGIAKEAEAKKNILSSKKITLNETSIEMPATPSKDEQNWKHYPVSGRHFGKKFLLKKTCIQAGYSDYGQTKKLDVIFYANPHHCGFASREKIRFELGLQNIPIDIKQGKYSIGLNDEITASVAFGTNLEWPLESNSYLKGELYIFQNNLNLPNGTLKGAVKIFSITGEMLSGKFEVSQKIDFPANMIPDSTIGGKVLEKDYQTQAVCAEWKTSEITDDKLLHITFFNEAYDCSKGIPDASDLEYRDFPKIFTLTFPASVLAHSSFVTGKESMEHSVRADFVVNANDRYFYTHGEGYVEILSDPQNTSTVQGKLWISFPDLQNNQPVSFDSKNNVIHGQFTAQFINSVPATK